MAFMSQSDLSNYLQQIQQNPSFTQAGQQDQSAAPATAKAPAPKAKATKRYPKRAKPRLV